MALASNGGRYYALRANARQVTPAQAIDPYFVDRHEGVADEFNRTSAGADRDKCGASIALYLGPARAATPAENGWGANARGI